MSRMHPITEANAILVREFDYIEQRCDAIPNPVTKDSVVAALHHVKKDWENEILDDAVFSAYLRRVYREYIAPTLQP